MYEQPELLPTPVMPAEGTDCHRLLTALMLGPQPNPNSRLNLMAHSRASDLRKMGWDVSVKRQRQTSPPPSGTRRKPTFVYSLDTPRELWPADAQRLRAGRADGEGAASPR